MTQNQVAYWNLQELKRHNAATEAETNRANVTAEQETSRKNRASESVQLMTHQEAVRHNLAQENLNITQLAETQRHNVAQELQFSIQSRETERHNRAQETETARHNTLMSSIQASQAASRERETMVAIDKAKLAREQFEFDKQMQSINTGIKGVDTGVKIIQSIARALK